MLYFGSLLLKYYIDLGVFVPLEDILRFEVQELRYLHWCSKSNCNFGDVLSMIEQYLQVVGVNIFEELSLRNHYVAGDILLQYKIQLAHLKEVT